MSSMSLLMLLRPLGMAAMERRLGADELPGKRTGRIARWRGDRPACRWARLNRNPPTKALSGRGA